MHHGYTIHFISPSPVSRSRLNLSARRFMPYRRCMGEGGEGGGGAQRYLNSILKMHKERP